jgi:hypothetical protein
MFLKDSYELIAAGFSDPEIDGVQFTSIGQKKSSLIKRMATVLKLKTGRYEDFYWSMYSVKSAWSKLKSSECDLIIANELSSLPLALELSKRCKARVFLDAHEFTPREFDSNPIWRFVFQKFWEYICSKYLSHVSAMTTVCRGIAEEYSRLYGVKCEVINNAPFFVDHEYSAVDGGHIRLVHHGGIHRSRKLKNMIFLIDHLDERFHLDFILVPNNDPSYYRQLQKKASTKGKITFRDPVPMTEIPYWLNEYDMGIYFLDPKGFNNKFALPNKFFEFIQARLGICIWPGPEMARIVKAHGLGIVSDRFSVESAAAQLNALTTEDFIRFKQNSDRAADVYCAEKNRDILIGIVDKLIGS